MLFLDERRRSQGNSFGDANQLFLGNLPHSATEDDLREIFLEFGQIVELRIHSKPLNYKGQAGQRAPPNYGFITYENQQAVQNCLQAKVSEFICVFNRFIYCLCVHSQFTFQERTPMVHCWTWKSRSQRIVHRTVETTGSWMTIMVRGHVTTTDLDRVVQVVRLAAPAVTLGVVPVEIDPTITTGARHRVVVRATTHSPPAASLFVHTLTDLMLHWQVESGREYIHLSF